MLKKIGFICLLLLSIAMIIYSFLFHKQTELIISLSKNTQIEIPALVIRLLFPMEVILGLYTLLKLISTRARLIDWLIEGPIRFSIICSISFMLVIGYYSSLTGVYDNFKDLLVNLHGIVVDFIVAGVLVTLYERYRGAKEAIERGHSEKREAIKRYNDEIEFSRDWHDEAARHKMIRIVNKLLEMDARALNLRGCYLPKSIFHDLFFKKTHFDGAILDKADFSNSKLIDCFLLRAKMSGAILSNCTVSGSDFSGADLTKATMLEVIAKDGVFDGTIFNDANLIQSDFSASSCKRTDFSKAVLKNAKFIGTDIRKADFSEADVAFAVFDNAKVDSINWLQHLVEVGAKQADKIGLRYEIDSQAHEDENGNEFFLVKNKA